MKGLKLTAYVVERTLFYLILLASLTFNYVGFTDYEWMETQMKLMKAEFIVDVVGYDYCEVEGVST